MPANLSFTGRIAGFCFRHKWYVLAAWLALFIGAAIASSGLSNVLTRDMKDLSGSDSSTATDLIKQHYGDSPLTELLVIRSAAQTVDDATYQTVVTDLSDQICGANGVLAVVNGASGKVCSANKEIEALVTTVLGDNARGTVSADHHATLTTIILPSDLQKAEDIVPGIQKIVQGYPAPAGFAIDMSGTASLNLEFSDISEHDIRSAETFGLPVALLVMIVAFGAVLAAIVPIALGFAAITLATGTVALVGRAFEFSNTVTSLISMIGLAVGIDYSLFIIGRYREELAKGHPRLAAMGIAADSSGRAVFFSGITVLFALAGMLLVRNNIFISIGVGAMVVVLIAVIGSLTLLPAILGILGGSIDRLRLPFLGKAHYGASFWTWQTNLVHRHAVLFAVGSAGLLIAAALPLTTISLGANGIETLPHDTQGYRAITALQTSFAGGLLDPLKVVVQGPIADPSVQAAIGRFKSAVDARTDLQWLRVIPAPGGRVAEIDIASTDLGTGSDATRQVSDLREQIIPQAFQGSGASVYLGGGTAIFVDVKNETDSKLPWVFAFVLGLSFVLLLLVFRSIAIPTKAVIMNLLSVGAAYGILVLVFQHGFLIGLFGFTKTPQIEFWIPLFLFSILFGLSMDYHVFLLSRVKEAYERTGNNTEAVEIGVRATAGMITSAALIMVSVFVAFSRGQLVALQQMGFGLAVSVFLDATVVRSVLVPASMELLGHLNWWFPSWLRWLPALDIEGAAARPVESAAVSAD